MPGKQFGATSAPLQTDNKSKLIAEYISLYQRVTHGGLFIDGFAGPQKLNFKEAWSARRVLEIEPKWIRHFWLCEMDPTSLTALRELKGTHHNSPKGRTVSVMAGDFNKSIRMILKSPKLHQKTPVFALLDQRTAECHWASVEAIAARAGKTNKIEQLYFLGVGWLQRSFAASTTADRQKELDQWWGGSGWRSLIGANHTTLVKTMADRFSNELGYSFVTPWPLFNAQDRKMFYLIHASDHPAASGLMKRAYRRVVGAKAGTLADSQISFLSD